MRPASIAIDMTLSSGCNVQKITSSNVWSIEANSGPVNFLSCLISSRIRIWQLLTMLIEELESLVDSCIALLTGDEGGVIVEGRVALPGLDRRERHHTSLHYSRGYDVRCYWLMD